MEEENKVIDIEELPSEPRQGSGSMLAAARKQQDKTIEEIAAELNLSVTQIKTIELDQTDGLPEPTYVRGYIRSYAKLLGLKPEEVLINYLNPDWQKTSSLNDIPKGIGRAEDTGPGFFTPLKMLVLLSLALTVAALWYLGLLDGLMANKTSEDITPQAEIVVDASEVRDAEGAATSTSELEEAPQLGSESSPAGSSAIVSGQDDLDGAEAGIEENVLLMRFDATSWVDIRDGDDQRLAYKSYAQGDTLEIREVGDLQVFIGNAAGVNVTLNGTNFDLSEHREGVYAKFVIDAVQ